MNSMNDPLGAGRCACRSVWHRLRAVLSELSQGLTAMGMHLYQVVGRHLPVVKKAKGTGEVLSVENKQKIYRMKVFAEDEVRACPAPPRSRTPKGSARPPEGAAAHAAALGVCVYVLVGTCALV